MIKNTLNQTGQILILVFVALGVTLFTVLLIIGGSQVYFQNAQYSYQSESAAAIAEAGVDKALASLNKTGGSYNGETETILGDGSYSVTVTNKDADSKILSSTGYIPGKLNPKTKRTITILATKGVGIAFSYGLQIGEGGISMGNGATLNGSIYSNGNITGGTSTKITGDVYVAGGVQATFDQAADCVGVNCQDYVFGKMVNGEQRWDVAQSFKPFQTLNLNKISLKLKKMGRPGNPNIRIMSDNNGKPDKNGVLATGTLSASLVATEYSFVDVTFDSTPTLTADTPYWIMIHANSLDNSNFWYWSNDLAQSYTRGVPKWSPNWQAGSPDWSAISGDLGFKTYMGGVATSVNLSNSSQILGNVHANTIEGNMVITKNAYYQILAPSVSVSGTKFPNSSDPPPTVFPVSEVNITDWKNQAEANGQTIGNITGDNSCVMALGPKKIVGNISLGNGCTVTVKTPLWVTGDISAGNSTIFVLDASYGATSGVIIVDGTMSLGNGSDLKGSGVSGSFLTILSTYDSALNGGDAINIGNSSISGIMYAPKGKVKLATGASIKEITAYQIDLGNNSSLTYDTGLSSVVFSSGPTGAYSLVKGTYQAK